MKRINVSDGKKGYSLIVLIIVIIVIMLLAMVSIASLRTSREKTAATNFIYDLNTVEEAVRSFYTSKGTLPTSTNEAQSIGIISVINPLLLESNKIRLNCV